MVVINGEYSESEGWNNQTNFQKLVSQKSKSSWTHLPYM